MCSLKIEQVPVGPMMNFAYLLGDDAKKVCAVVDPGWDIDKIISEAATLGWKIEKILLTHTHFDHSQALPELCSKTHAEVYVHEAEANEISKDIKKTSTKDGTIIDLGTLKIKCIHTPGHTVGSQCFLVEKSMFTGDTLFVDGCGRVDLPGSDPKEMLLSLKKISLMDPAITIYPGHDYGSSEHATIGEQLKRNPYLGKL